MKRILLSAAVGLFLSQAVSSQSLNDYRTRQSGYWHNASTWERHNGSTWVLASSPPEYSTAERVTVLQAHEVYVSTEVHTDQTYVAGILNIQAGADFNIRNGGDYDLTVYIGGQVLNAGEIDVYTSATLEFRYIALYRHDQNGGSIPKNTTWDAHSIVEIKSVTANKPTNLDQNFGDFIWNCSTQSNDISLAGNLTQIQGDFTLLSTNGKYLKFSETAGCNVTIGGDFEIGDNCKFQIAGGGADNNVEIGGDFHQTGGDFTMSDASGSIVNMTVDGDFTLEGDYFRIATADAYSKLYLKGDFTQEGGFLTYTSTGTEGEIIFCGTSEQSFVKSGGSINNKVNITVSSGAILTLGDYVLGDWSYTTGIFTLQSGATLITSHSGGIAASGAGGCIQNNGTRSFSQGAHYRFTRNGTQATGSGLPSTVSGSVTIGSQSTAAQLTFSNSTSVSGTLYIINGTVSNTNLSYASSGILEYSGDAAQTTGNNEWPSSTVPNLRINNTSVSGVTLNESKTVSTQLNLMKGTLSIASNTLTLNGTISKSDGSLAGGVNSSILLGGSGSTTLPGVANGLNNLTLNRSGSVITVGGGINIYGTLSLTAGTFSLGSGSITYGTYGILSYNGTGNAQTTSNAEFPASSGPLDLKVSKSSQVLNLHASRQINGSIFLDSGTLNLGSATLNLAGDFATTAGSISSSSGGLLVFSENGSGGTMPSSSGIYSVSVDRALGVSLAGNVTIENLLTLTNGNLALGNHQLTINGGISVVSGGLTGSTGCDIIMGGTGVSTGLPPVETAALTLNRASGISLLGDVTVHDLLTLTNGCLTIGANTLYINGLISATENGSLGNSSSVVQVNEMPVLETLLFPAAELSELVISRQAGTQLDGAITLHNSLILNSGNCLIGNYKTLTINGELQENGGSLTSTQYSNLSIGGSGDAFGLDLSLLNDLTINRPNGVQMNSSLQIYGTLTLGEGMIIPGENDLTYASGASLRYRGSTTQTTSDAEWPEVSGPGFLISQNAQGIKLHASRTLQQGLSLMTGTMAIQNNTLTLNGGLFSNGGSLAGGMDSNLEIGGDIMQMPLQLPAITLNNLTMNRANGLLLMGNLDLYGQMNILSGTISIENQTLTLRNPVTGLHQSLLANSNSGLIIAGTSSGMDFGPSENLQMTELGRLEISNTHSEGVFIRGNLTITNDLRIGEFSKLSLEPGARVEINGSIDNQSGVQGLVLMSSAQMSNPDASLIHNDPGVQATVTRQVEAANWEDGEEGWHLLSAPVDYQTISGDWTPQGSGNDYDFYAWDESLNLWLNQKIEENEITYFMPGRAYFAAYQSGNTMEFEGSLNVEFFNLGSLSHTEGGAYAGWHLAGNPYSSALDWGHPGWLRHNVSPQAKVWAETMKSYRDVTEDYNNIIPPMNGFMVYVYEGQSGELLIPPTARVHPQSGWLKSGPSGSIVLAAVEEDQRSTQECILREAEGATVAYDPGLDNRFMAGFAPRFYTMADGKDLSLNSLPRLDSSAIIPLFFVKNKAQNFSIRLIQGFQNPERNIFLTDRKLGIETRLTESTEYAFVSSEGDSPDRFLLHFVPLQHETPDSIKVQVYMDANGINVKGALPGWQISLISLQGQVILDFWINNEESFRIPTHSMAQGLYLVRLVGQDVGICTKVLVK